MELEGQIQEFIYQNDTNNYTIAVMLTSENEVVTVVGYLPFITERRLSKGIWKDGCSPRIW